MAGIRIGDEDTGRAGAFVGRERELAELAAGLTDATAERSRLYLVSGEPGIGKSRLITEFAAHAHGQDATVLWGRCWEAGGAPPYWPWVQALRALVRTLSPQEARTFAGLGASDLVQILPEIAELIPDLQTPTSPDPESARFRLFDSTASFFREASRSQPIVIILEDLHAADVPSMLLLRFIVGQLQQDRLLIVGTYRDVELTPDHPLTATVAEVTRDPATVELPLTGLSDPDVLRFVELTSGLPATLSLAASLQREAKGNPLFLGEAVRLLLSEGRIGEITDPTALHVTVPPHIQEVITRRVRHLGDTARASLTTAAVLGTEFRLEVLQALDDLSSDPLSGSIGEAVVAGLLVPVPGAPSSFRYSHELIRETLYGELAAEQRASLHERAGLALERIYGDAIDAHLAEVAYHYFQAANLDPARAVDRSRRAGERAVRSLAYEEAVNLLAMAVQAFELVEDPSDTELADALLELGDAQSKAGELPSAQGSFLRAATIARGIGSSDRLARAALGYGGRFVWGREGGDQQLVPLLQDALVLLGGDDDVLRVRLLGRLSCALRSSPERERGAALSQQAVDLARQLDDPQTLAYALDARFGATWWPENPEERLELAEELVRIAEDAADMERVTAALMAKYFALADLGQMDEARAMSRLFHRRVDELRQPAYGWLQTALLGQQALLEGRFDEEEQLIRDTHRAGIVSPAHDGTSVAVFQSYLLRREQGRSSEVVDAVREAAESFIWYPMFRGALANLLIDTGHVDEARAVVEDAARTGFAFTMDNEWLATQSVFAEASARLGDERSAEMLHELLTPHAGRHAIGHGEGSMGSVDRYLGLLERSLGRPDDAVRSLEAAVEMNDRMRAVPLASHARHELATVLLERDAPGDGERAALLLEAARAEAERIGMTSLLGRIDELEAPPAPTRRSDAAATSIGPSVFRREGEYWTVSFDGDAARIRDSKGVRHLAILLERPGAEVHALELVRAVEGADTDGARIDGGDAGPVLDDRAKREYRQRAAEIEQELDEARAWNDGERVAKLRRELELIAGELTSSVGIGGRDRRAAGAAERARINVTRAIRSALDRIDDAVPALGAHLRATVRTGTFCAYMPDPRATITWQR